MSRSTSPGSSGGSIGNRTTLLARVRVDTFDASEAVEPNASAGYDLNSNGAIDLAE